MKKALIIALCLLFCFCLVSCGGISEDKATEIALNSLGFTKVYVQKWEVELDKTVSPAVYKVSIWNDSRFDVFVDSKSGDILSTDVSPANC
jgi:uncharacterized membrane protein YkoI